MIQLRKAADRGHAHHGWLNTWYSFSFADYFDPDFISYSALRVINEDRIAPGAGFPTHSHRDMEIITYMLQGALEHKDSMGNGSVIRPGDVQRMSAGKGVSHSEFNASDKEEAHLLQIWMEPSKQGIEPGYEQKSFSNIEKSGQFRLLASPDGEAGSVIIHQDARLYATLLDSQEEVDFSPLGGRRLYLHLARGQVELNGVRMDQGDAARITDETIHLLGLAVGSEALLFDLP
jgi:redox-sensitive bicupin YhaK (pirin superfamily)